MHPVAAVIASLCIGTAVSTLVMVLWWYIGRAFLRPIIMTEKYMDSIIDAHIDNFGVVAWGSIVSLPRLIISALYTSISVVLDNFFWIGCLVIIASACLVWLDHHDSMIKSYYVVRQCYVQEVINLFILPLADLIVLLFNAVIGVFDFIMNMQSAVEFVAPITLLKCSLHEEVAGNILYYLTESFYAFIFDLNHWVAAGITTHEWNVLNTLRTLSYVIDTLVPVGNCFCSILTPLWEAISMFASETSVHYFINCLLNFAVRLGQIVTATIKYFVSYILPGFNPVRPDFTNATNTACCALYNAGDAVEDGVFLLIEAVWGILGRDMPPELRQLLSTDYASVVTHTLCGVARVVNMTATIAVNLNDEPGGFLEANGRGIRYLQFGFVADEVRIGARKLGEPFYILSPSARAFVTQLALSAVGIAAFLAEWLVGNVWFFIWAPPSDVLPHYPAPLLTGIYRYLDFLYYYFPNYWLKDPPGGTPITSGTYTYSSALAELYRDTMFLAEAAGDLAGLLNNPLGCLVEHLLKSIITLISLLCQIVSFFMTIFTFQADLATTARAVQIDTFILELRYTSDCAGTLISQFGNCTVTENDEQDNFFCCLGHAITDTLDVVISLLEQVAWFVLDILALPTEAVDLCLFGAYNPSKIECMRIPNLAIAIAKAENALYDLSCALANIVPVFNGFNCIFPPGDGADYSDDNSGGGSLFDEFSDFFTSGPAIKGAPCHAITSCTANFIYSIVRIVLVPFYILNQFFVQLIQGNPFTNLYNFLNYSGGIIAKTLGRAADSLAILVDCSVCAFIHDGVDCGTIFYTLMHYVFVVPLIGLAGTFGVYSFALGRIVLGSLKDILNGNGYYGLYSIISKVSKMMGIYGEAANFWFNRVFSTMGLYLAGSTFSATNHGVCDTVEVVINYMAAAITTISAALLAGALTVPKVAMCCYGSFACFPLVFKKRDFTDTDNDIGSTVTLTPDTWIAFFISHPNASRVFNWRAEDSCNASMLRYKNEQWQTMASDQKQEVFFCLYKILWPVRTDGQSMVDLPNSTCDDAMIGHAADDWTTLRPLEKSFISNCIMSRQYIDHLRHSADIPWFPQDWWTNEYRQMHFGRELIYAMRIYYQYMMDQTTSPVIIMNPAYQNAWLSMGLNISHYNGLVTTDDVLRMRTHYHLKDYFVWNNNATQYDPVSWVTTGFWSVLEALTEHAANTSSAFSDNTTDPTVYLAYEYHTDQPGGVDDGLFFSMMSKVFSTINDFAKRWSKPENLKKRANFFNETQRTASNVYAKLTREKTRMSIEWWKSMRHNVSILYGEGEANETFAFMEEYERSLYGLDPSYRNRSIFYRLNHWWENVQMPVVKRVPTQRDGKVRNSAPNQGNETTYERLSRYISFFREGSPGANDRVSRLTTGFRVMRNRFYTKVIEQRIEEIRQQHITQKTVYTKAESGGLTAYHMNTRSVDPPEALNETKQLRLALHEDAAAEKHHIHKYTAMRHKIRSQGLMMDKVYTHSALVRMNSLLDFTCTSSSAILCADCYVLDVFVGRIEHGLEVTNDYYTGGQYGTMFNNTMDLFAYSMNESAPARLGDSTELPAVFPWRYYSNWRILGDDTPNKLRFDDLFNMTSKIGDDFGLSFQNSTLYTNIDYGSLHGIIQWLITRGCYSLIEFLYRVALFVFSPTGTTDATASIAFLLNNWVVCQWNTGDSINGRFKRWSIGESLFGYGVFSLAIMILFNGVFRINVWAIISATGFSGTIFIFTFLGITYNWAVLCWPSQPFSLLYDINYFLVHTLATKCDWVFSGLVKGDYNNNVCASCAYTLDIEIENCREAGARDLLTTIVFFLENFAPWVLQWVRDTTLPVYILYQIPYINERLNVYANVNMDDPRTFAFCWTCNTTVTIVPFLFLAAFFFIIFKFFLPAFTIIFTIPFSLSRLIYILYLINRSIANAISYTIVSYPYMFLDDNNGEEEEPEEEDEDSGSDYADEDASIIADDTEIQLRNRKPYQRPFISQFTRQHQD